MYGENMKRIPWVGYYMHVFSHPEALLLLHVLLCTEEGVDGQIGCKSQGENYQYLLSDEMIVPLGTILLGTKVHC